MRAIIISDADAKALLDQLKLESLQRVHVVMQDDPSKPPTIADVHRVFHYVVCRWLQEQGANVTR